MLKRLAILGLSVCLIVVGAAAVLAQDEEACWQKGGNLIDGKCVLGSEIRIDIEYPLELAENAIVSATIDPFLQARKDEFVQIVTGDFSPTPGPYDLDIGYEILHHDDAIVSLVFTVYEFTGGAHGMTTFQTYTFDLDAETLITLDDLFLSGSDPFAVIAPLAQEEVTSRLGEMLDTEWLEMGTGDNPDNYQFFALDADALVFYFPPYQVAPYAAGPQIVRVPLSALNGVIAPRFAS